MEELIEIEDQKIWVERQGDLSAPPIIFIAGAGAHAHFWTDSFLQFFLPDYQVIRYDHRDVGLSDATAEGYDVYRLAKDVLEIFYTFCIDKAHLVGHSMGGYIAQLLAESDPSRLFSMTLISSGPVGMTDTLKKPQTEEEKRILTDTWRVMLQNRPRETFEESWAGFKPVWERLNGSYPLDENLAKNYTRELFTRSKHKVGVHSKHVKAMQKLAETLESRKEIFSKIETPTLIIQGKEDPLILPERGGKALFEVLPHAELEIIPKMGHMLFNKDLENVVAKKILAFIKKHS